MEQGKVYLVGAGPGDEGYITSRGLELISRADVVVYDYLASGELLSHCRPDARLIYVGKQAHDHTMSQERISQLLVDEAQANKCVVRLKGGDPFMFGRGGEECLELARNHVPFEVVPGVTAAAAAGACAAIPLTDRRFASAVAFVTGHECRKDHSSLDWSLLARWKGTLVFYMGVANLPEIVEKLQRNGCDAAAKPAAIVQWAGTPQQRVIVDKLANLPQAAKREGISAPALIIVGEVVSLREHIEWFERRPLFGRRIVVTRARAQASRLVSMLRELGAEAIELPAIRIVPACDDPGLVDAIEHIWSFGWVVFTSVNAADAFLTALFTAGRDSRSMSGAKIAAIGPATAERLFNAGLRADVMPDEHTSTGLVAAMASLGELDGASVLCPRSNIAGTDLADGLSAKGAKVTQAIAYRTLREEAHDVRIAELLAEGKVDWLTFTSSSTATNLLCAVGAADVVASGAKIASIGPVTSATLQKQGLNVDAQAQRNTIDGLVRAIVDFEADQVGN